MDSAKIIYEGDKTVYDRYGVTKDVPSRMVVPS